ncbi:uncharacterized protein LOC128231176 [Mya arenaria]|uniref:uncharacterized protein LOC128231176 n=1 Tax=Mya arenaria TaxID=6604 RepID=UPI0022E122DB|nr:uncharacterized protein LOC128231176 [Mya arenaria]
MECKTFGKRIFVLHITACLHLFLLLGPVVQTASVPGRTVLTSNPNNATATRVERVKEQLTTLKVLERYYQQLFVRGYLTDEATRSLAHIRSYMRILETFLQSKAK